MVATDGSEPQIAHARPAAGIRYAVMLAEAPGLMDGSFDLVTVAQALHWLDLDGFGNAARRVLRPGGVLAAWCYGLLTEPPEIAAAVGRFSTQVVGAWWPPRRRHIDTGYADLELPCAPLPSPFLSMTVRWTLPELLGYVGTWSAVDRCRAATGADPVGGLARELVPLWGEPGARRRIAWPLHVRAGRV